MTHMRVFFCSNSRHQSTVTEKGKKKKEFVSRNRAINKLVPPRDDNRKIPWNDIALLKHACVGEGLLYRKSTPHGVFRVIIYYAPNGPNVAAPRLL